jgi:DNA polymerase-3 subunit delta'
MSWTLIGHQWAVRMLDAHIMQDALKHAYLITGPDSIGKRTLAMQFAQAVNCSDYSQGGEVCGQCRACLLTPKGTFPDLHWVASEREGDVLKVDQVRQLQRQLALAPFEGRYRVAVLPRFQEASESAANALLKTLEEPPPQVILLLTAHSRESLLPTIVSRCEVLDLRPVALQVLEEALLAHGAEAQQAHLLASLAGGRPGWALRMLSDPSALEQRHQLMAELSSILNQSKVERFKYSASLARAKSTDASRKQTVFALETWLGLWRDALVHTLGDEKMIRNIDQEKILSQLATHTTPDELFQAARATEQALDSIEQYANVQLTLENLMLDYPSIPE